MADNLTPEQRHKCMAAIKGKNTKPEMIVRRFLHSAGYRYGLHNKKLPGKPDIVLRKYKTVIFIHGCFWHGHEGCKFSHLPKSNFNYWEQKINHNKERDLNSKLELVKEGWKVITIWECDLRDRNKRESVLYSLLNQLKSIKNQILKYPYIQNNSIAAEAESQYVKIN